MTTAGDGARALIGTTAYEPPAATHTKGCHVSTTVRDNPAENRYEIHDGERLAGLSTYKLTGRRIAFIHTETAPEFSGRGLARRLVAGELDDARRRGLAVLPFCPYVRKVIAQNAAAYLDLVPEKDRERFGLARTDAP